MTQAIDAVFLEKHPGMEKFVANNFEIIRRNKSSWVKDGTGGDSGVPSQRMDTSKSMMLLPDSRLYLGKGKGYLPTQYVIGAPTIYVNDYYVDKDGKLVTDYVTPKEAEAKKYILKQGLKSLNYDLKAEYGRSMALEIEFTFGQLDVRKYGDDPMLLKFIMEHEQNEAAPNASENRDPKRLKLFQFRPSIPELKAAKGKIVENFDDDFEAMALVGKTRSKGEKGAFKYNEPLMNTYLAILEDGRTLKEGEVNQKFEIIAKWARRDGAEFLRIVNGAINDCKADILVATTLGVIKFTADAVKFSDGGGKKLIDTEAKDKDAVTDELVNHLLGTEAGVLDYAEMTRLVEIAKLDTLKK